LIVSVSKADAHEPNYIEGVRAAAAALSAHGVAITIPPLNDAGQSPALRAIPTLIEMLDALVRACFADAPEGTTKRTRYTVARRHVVRARDILNSDH
jgi:hypothetical protein